MNHLYDNYIIVFEETEHFELAKHPFGTDERLENVGHFFQCDSFPISRICHRPVFNKEEKKNKFVIEFLRREKIKLPHNSVKTCDPLYMTLEKETVLSHQVQV